MSDVIPVGMVGCAQGTHGPVWAEMLAQPDNRFGMQITRVWDSDPQAAESIARLTGATPVADHRAVADGVAGILITEPYPETYLERARPFLEAGQHVFFNRPLAGSVAEAQELSRLAQQHGAKIYSASALYHTQAGAEAVEKLPALGPVRLFHVTGPSGLIYYYLPHTIACLLSVLGPGVNRVQAASLSWPPDDPRRTPAPVVVYVEYGPEARCPGARGTLNMTGPEAEWYGFRLKLFGAKAEGDEVRFEVSYDRLLYTMAEFFRTGVEPIPHAILIEKTAIFYAALSSARAGGCAVTLADLLNRG